MRYITIQEFCEFHGTDRAVVEEIVEFGIVTTDYHGEQLVIVEKDLTALEMAIRLHRDLGVNPAGIDTILIMRQRLVDLQEQLTQLQARLRQYER